MYEFPDIMEKYRAIPKDHPNRKYEIVKLCLEKYQYMLDHGGMDFDIRNSTCPACAEWQGCSPGCIFYEAGYIYTCNASVSPWQWLVLARKDNNQEAFTVQVKWFVAFFENWLVENAPTITEVLQ